MNKISLSFMRERIFWYCLVVVQGILFALLSIYMMNEQYQDSWKKYGDEETSLMVSLNSVPKEKEGDVENFFYRIADENELYVIKHDYLVDNDGNFAGQEFGIYGYTNNCAVGFDYAGKDILTEDDVNKLLQSEEAKSTIGIDVSSKLCIKELPNLLLGNKVVLKKLGSMIEEKNTVEGNYIIEGASSDTKEKIVEDLETLLGQSKEEFLYSKSGFNVDSSLRRILVLGLILGDAVVGGIYLLVYTLRKLKMKGVLALQGWSNGDFAAEIFAKFLTFSVVLIPVFVIGTIVASGWLNFTIPNVLRFLYWAMVCFLLTCAEMLISIFLVFCVSPLKAIKKYYPTKLLYFIGVVSFVITNIVSVWCCIYIDKPLKQISDNVEILNNWEKVEDYCLLSTVTIGDDQASYSGQSNKLDQDVFNWYKTVSDKDGVYLVNTLFYDHATLDYWRDNCIYKNIPESEFWYFSMSPNYLMENGISIDTETVVKARAGVRVYLIPSGMSAGEKAELTNWLEESTKAGILDSDIETTFKNNKEFQFVEYSSNKELFTWAVEKKNGVTSRNPVIYVCTPENMTYYENESLRTTGLDGYIKFKNEKVANECTDLLGGYSLADNNILTDKVGAYIDGLQKNLKQIVMWFGIFYVGLIIVLLLLLLALATIFIDSNKELITVKTFLGYSFYKIYKYISALLIVVSVADAAVIILFKSKVGVMFFVAYQVVLWFIYSKYLTKKTTLDLVKQVREG